MLGYLARRLLGMVVLLLAISVVTFVLFFVMPGDPAAASLPRNASAEVRVQVRQRMGLDQPLWKQYRDFLHGPDRVGTGRSSGLLNWPPNLGYSFKNQEPVLTIIADRLPVTLSLVAMSALLWLLIGIPIGVQAGRRPRSLYDRAASGFVLLGVSTPVFLTGLALLHLFYLELGWLPAPGYTPLTEDPFRWAARLLLPSLSVALGAAALYTRLVRAGILEAQGEDFLRTARAKGLPERQVIIRHALRVTLAPVVTLLGLDMAALIGGAVVVEQLFGLPGIAQVTVQSLVDLDLPVVVGVVLTTSFFVVTFNLVVDVAYVLLDPRLRKR